MITILKEFQMTYHVSLYRPKDVWQNFRASCNGVVVTYRAGMENGMATLAKALVDAGFEDGEIEIVETHSNNPLKQSLPSLFTLANPVPTTITESVSPISESTYTWLGNLIAGSLWTDVPLRMRGVLRDRHFVDDAGLINDLGRETHAKWVPVEKVVKEAGKRGRPKSLLAPKEKPLINAKQHEALAMCPISEHDWAEKVHHLCRRALILNGWVKVKNGVVYALSITEIEKKAADLIANPKPKVEKPSSNGVPIVVAKKWKTVLTGIQSGNQDIWKYLHGKSKNTMQKQGLVVVSDGVAKATPAGIKFIK
jgi:hypothetical protein